MADKGWIKLNRQIMDHWTYKDKPFNRSMAWIDLLLLADHKTHKSLWRGRLTEFKRGDVNISLTELGRRWGWSPDKVRHFISDLESDGMLRKNATTQRTTLTLIKYDDFQISVGTEQTTKQTTKPATDKTTEQTTEQTYLKNKKNNKEIIKNDKKPQSQFYQYQQNEYDYEELERRLLGH